MEYEFESSVQEDRLRHTLGVLSLHNGGTYHTEPLTAPTEFVSTLELAAAQGVDGVEQFLAESGKGDGWRESSYENYETVMVNLVFSPLEEALVKGCLGGALFGTMVLTTAVVVAVKK